MIYVKCLDKNRDKNGIITQYKLCDANGSIQVVDSLELKNKIFNKE